MCSTLGMERPNNSPNLQTNNLNNTKRAITHQKIMFFEKFKKGFLDNYIRNVT